MTATSPRILWVAAAMAALVTLGCTSGGGYRDDRDRPASGSRLFALYRVEIDHQAVKNGARLLFSEPPPGAEFGGDRRAGGQFTISDTGLVSVRVGVVESGTGMNGRKVEYGYKLLDFSGRVAEDGKRATIFDGDRIQGVDGGRVDEVRFETIDSDRLKLQPYSEGRPRAYRFYFTRSRVSVRPDVEFPWR